MGLEPADHAAAGVAVLAPGRVVTTTTGGGMTAPRDGRLRGPDFTADVTGVAWPGSVVAGGLARVAGVGQRLVVFGLRVTQPGQDVGPLSPSTVAVATLTVGHEQLPVDLSAVDQAIEGAGPTVTGHGEATYAASVPVRTHDVVLSVAEGGFSQRFDLWTLRRLSPAPAVLYRSLTSATVADTQPQTASLPVTNPADGYTAPATVELTRATLTEFAPDGTTPSAPTQAFCVVDLAARYTPGTVGQSNWGHFFSTLTPLAGTRLTFTPAGGQPVPASTAPLATTVGTGPNNDGLLAQQYWFAVPASVTSGTIAVTAGPAVGIEYVGFEGTASEIPLTLPQTVTLAVAFPTPPATVTQPTPPWVGKPPPSATAPTSQVGATRAPTSGRFPLRLAVLLVAALAVAGIAFERYRRVRRGRPVPIPTEGRPGTPQHGERVGPGRPADTVDVPEQREQAPGSHRVPPDDTRAAPVAARVDVLTPAVAPVPALGPDGSLAVRVLGPVEVTGWQPPPDRRGVLEELCCFLALHPERAFSTDEVLGALWPVEGEGEEPTPKTPRNNLSRLRRAVGTEHLPDAVFSGGYRLTDCPTDWSRARQLVAEAEGSDVAEAERLLAEALAHVRGVPFAGAARGQYSWALSSHLVHDMTVAVVGAAHRLAGLRLARGDATGTVEAARAGLRVSTEEYALWGDLERAAKASGDPSALRRFVAEAERALGKNEAHRLLGRNDPASDTR